MSVGFPVYWTAGPTAADPPVSLGGRGTGKGKSGFDISVTL